MVVFHTISDGFFDNVVNAIDAIILLLFDEFEKFGEGFATGAEPLEISDEHLVQIRDELFGHLRRDPELGSRLLAPHTPLRLVHFPLCSTFVLTDVFLILNFTFHQVVGSHVILFLTVHNKTCFFIPKCGHSI